MPKGTCVMRKYCDNPQCPHFYSHTMTDECDDHECFEIGDRTVYCMPWPRIRRMGR
jgi:hypothetical protein